MNYKDTYIGRLLNAISQLGNTLIGGNPDVSISARIGYNTYFYNRTFYKVAETVVDFTFYPIDGKQHCRNAYLRDRKEDYKVGNENGIGEVLMVMILQLACVPLSILFWSYYGIRKAI